MTPCGALIWVNIGSETYADWLSIWPPEAFKLLSEWYAIEIHLKIDGLMQMSRNSIANAME